ncbi:hypothetical protein [Kluyvera georgiana]|uniref:hypothetical protein n=1 Tax=Kluyvera georgiana TaxID=73098 RepID=UPI003AF0A2C2
MRVFVVWEAYSTDWKLIRKGSDFLIIGDPDLIDIRVDEFAKDTAERLYIDREYLVVSSIQQLNLPE